MFDCFGLAFDWCVVDCWLVLIGLEGETRLNAGTAVLPQNPDSCRSKAAPDRPVTIGVPAGIGDQSGVRIRLDPVGRAGQARHAGLGHVLAAAVRRAIALQDPAAGKGSSRVCSQRGLC